MPAQRISYVPLDDMTPDMREEMERCAREGTPRPESSAIRAHVPKAFWFFANSWKDLFREGIVDHDIKELCRVYVSRSIKCEYCGNQRSEQGRALGLTDAVADHVARQALGRGRVVELDAVQQLATSSDGRTVDVESDRDG